MDKMAIFWSALLAFVIGLGSSVVTAVVEAKGELPSAGSWIVALFGALVVGAKDARSLMKLPPVDGGGTPPSRLPLLLAIGWVVTVVWLFTGCGAMPVQVKAGSDPLVVNAEWLAENGANSLDQFLAFERQNEAALRGKFPQAHGMADLIRDDVVEIKPGQFVPASILKLRTLTKMYQADKSALNGDRVAAASKALLSLVNEVRGYMGVPALTFPAAHPSVMDLMQNAPTNAPPQ
jgi:hypothetical protein